MTNSENTSIEEFDDIESINKYRELCKTTDEKEALRMLNFGSRDNARHTMTWTGEKYGGFSDTEPWITMYSRAKEINLENDLKSEKSVFRFYKRLIQLRKSLPALTVGEFRLLSGAEDNFMITERVCVGQKVTVICNFETESFIDFSCDGEIILSNLGRSTAGGTYRPYEIAVFLQKFQ